MDPRGLKEGQGGEAAGGGDLQKGADEETKVGAPPALRENLGV